MIRARVCGLALIVLVVVLAISGTSAPPPGADGSGSIRQAPPVVEPVTQLLRDHKLAEAQAKARELMLAHADEPMVQQELYWLLGIIRLREGRYEQAVTAADALEGILREHPIAQQELRDRPLMLRFQAYMELKRFADARQAVLPLLARPESDAGFLRGVRYTVQSHVAEGRPAEGAKFLDERLKAAKTPPVKGNILLLSADLKQRAGEKEAASGLLTRAVTEYPQLQSQAAAMRTAWEGSSAAGCGCGTPAPQAQSGCGCGSSESPPANAPPSSGGCCGAPKAKE